jgi:hypothetical protein
MSFSAVVILVGDAAATGILTAAGVLSPGFGEIIQINDEILAAAGAFADAYVPYAPQLSSDVLVTYGVPANAGFPAGALVNLMMLAFLLLLSLMLWTSLLCTVSMSPLLSRQVCRCSCHWMRLWNYLFCIILLLYLPMQIWTPGTVLLMATWE